MDLFRFLLVGLAAGWVMGRIVRGRGFGLLGNIAIGALGALIGGYLFGFLGVPVDNILGAIVMAVVGAVVLFLLFGLVKPSRRSQSKKEEADK